MQNASNQSPISASQEISLLKGAHKLNKLITSMGFQLPLRLLAYDSVQDLSPIGLVLLGYEVHAVYSDPTSTQRLEAYVGMYDKSLTCTSSPLLELASQTQDPFDVVLLNGIGLTELRTDAQLQAVFQQLAAILKPDGLLLITSADFDETLRVKERVLPARITDDETGRHIHTIVRDWHGNGYEYTETHYLIEHREGALTVTHHPYQRRAWRRVEIALALAQAGVGSVQWQSNIMTARKAPA